MYPRNSYIQISKFGQDIQPPCSGTNDPLTYCLQDTMDINFQHGSIGHLYGPRSRKCQLYMTQRCADKWDGFCEYYYKANSDFGNWPDNQNWPDTVQPNTWQNEYGLNPSLTTGEQLLKNVAERKYCSYLNCVPKYEPFDPTNPSTPDIVYYTEPNGYGENCFPVCDVINPSTIDNDPVMSRMLENPKIASSTLINICNTAKRNGTNLNGTRLGKVCDKYFQNMNSIKKNH